MENNESVVSGGIEYLRNLGLKEVSNRTFIHEDELKKFLDGEFTGINKTKAMGFIQILEREFNIDLSDLKAQYVNYLNEHKDDEVEPKQSLIMEEVQSEERKKGIFSFLFLLAAIGSIAYVIDKYELLDFSTPSDIKTAKVDTKEVKNAQLNLEKLNQPEEKKDDSKNQESVTNNTQENTVDTLEQNTVETNNEVETTTDEEQNSDTQNTDSTENNQNDGVLDLSKLNEELNSEASNSDIEKDINSITEDTAASDENNSTNDEAVTNEIYIMPNHKVWIGTIELDSLEKKDFLAPKGKRVDIDGSTDKLIMIGHKFVKIYLNDKQVKFKRRGPLRFKYIDGELTEINRKEFNKLAKGRQW